MNQSLLEDSFGIKSIVLTPVGHVMEHLPVIFSPGKIKPSLGIIRTGKSGCADTYAIAVAAVLK